MTKYLYETLETLDEAGLLAELPSIIEASLSDKIVLRNYQIKAFRYFVSYFENDNLHKNKQIHNLFHMATGSGKTVLMAGLIMYLYTRGYRNFLFFVNQSNILEKTKENFTNKSSNKYLFQDEISYLGSKINIKMVDNFSGGFLNDDIQICFTTTQKLHQDLIFPRENSLTLKDFEDQKVVFISDESHHINTLTKKATKEEEEAKNSWEYSVTKAFLNNRDNILLEFTATADIKDKNVALKYEDKMIFNYPLKNFRESGYTKDFQNFATDTDLWRRSLMALILSEYRKYLFADNKLNIKPVIMMKSQTIAESGNFYAVFFENLASLTTEEIKGLYGTGVQVLNDALDYFKKLDENFDTLIESLRASFAKDYSMIMNGSTENTKENQLLVNSLEDVTNPIRVIFAVDMLNEGWDVLNLFDIVRLYDTRQGSGTAGKVGSYTIKEAQLIGRGARYCPFQFNENQERFKRKYDYDLAEKNRILETMLFHSKNDSRYIAELKQALIESGLQAVAPKQLVYKLKSAFKDSDFYKNGIVFSNKRIQKDRKNINSIEASLQNEIFRYQTTSNKGIQISLFDDYPVVPTSANTAIRKFFFKQINYNVLVGASERFPELSFDVLKGKFPCLNSTREFLTSSSYCGNCSLEITYTDELKGIDLYKACVKACAKIASYVVSIKAEYSGSMEFYPHQLKSVLTDKIIYLSEIDADGGKGASQTNCPNDAYRLDLSMEDWYVFSDNYGTSEEKLFIKFFKTDIEPKLKAKGLEYYVVRNERVPDLAIYSFKDGERVEPDFLLFLRKKKIDNSYLNHQVYAEPKGMHLLLLDSWKENFLLDITQQSITHYRNTANEYKIVGLPFFNNACKTAELVEAIDKLISNL